MDEPEATEPIVLFQEMKIAMSARTCGLVSLLAVVSAAPAQDLLIPVTGVELAEVRADNDYFINRHLFFAKRHKIVRVDAELLKSEESLNVGLFDGLTITIARENVHVSPGREIYWTGLITDPAFDPDYYHKGDRTTEYAHTLYVAAFDVRLSAVAYDRELTTGTAFEATRGYTAPSIGSAPPVFEEEAFYEVYADFSAPTLPGRYRLRALETNPEYHVLYEVDREKIYTGAPAQ